jgi:hypothetical protein
MTVQAMIVMTGPQKDAAVLLNDDEIQVQPPEVTNSLANNLGYGTLVGQFVVGARLLNDPDYTRWVSTLGTYPIHVMDSDTLFTPSPVGP